MARSAPNCFDCRDYRNWWCTKHRVRRSPHGACRDFTEIEEFKVVENDNRYKPPHPCSSCGHRAASGSYCWKTKVYVDQIDACPAGYWGVMTGVSSAEVPTKRTVIWMDK